MSADQDFENSFYSLRHEVYNIGTVTIHFDQNFENDVVCICSRVLLDYCLKSSQKKSKRTKAQGFQPESYFSGPLVPVNNIASFEENSVVENLRCDSNLNQLALDYPVEDLIPNNRAVGDVDDALVDLTALNCPIADEIAISCTIEDADETLLINSDSENQTTTCCVCFETMLRNIREIFRWKKKRKARDQDEPNVEPSTSHDGSLVEPTNHSPNGDVPSIFENSIHQVPRRKRKLEKKNTEGEQNSKTSSSLNKSSVKPGTYIPNVNTPSIIEHSRKCKRRTRQRRKKKTLVQVKQNTGASVSRNKHLVEPETCISNGNCSSVTMDMEDDDSPLEFSSKYDKNNIKTLGFAYQQLTSTKMPRISCVYDEYQILKWNASLSLQKVNWVKNTSTPWSTSHGIEGLDDFDTEQDNMRLGNGKRRRSPETNEEVNVKTVPVEIRANPEIQKYWNNRYRLFSKYDSGIKLDTESWYSVTPEKLSKHIADRCRCDIIIDGFCGAGGNTIQFAFTCERVIAIDIDPEKIKLAKHNAKIYEVEDRIEFIVGDFFKIAPSLKADVVFLSPPWGGPLYNRQPTFPLQDICPPYGGKYIFDIARKVTENIAFYLPRNINTHDLMILPTSDRTLELEQNLLVRRLFAVTAYFGELVINELE